MGFYGRITGENGWRLLKTERVPVGGDAHPPVAPVYAGYTFREWGNRYTDIQANINIYAQYDANPGAVRTYTVKFWDGSKLLSSQTVMEGGNALAPAAPVKNGYWFDGWDTSYVVVNSNLDVQAVFKKNQTGLITTEEFQQEIRALNLPIEVEERAIELGILLRDWIDSPEYPGKTRSSLSLPMDIQGAIIALAQAIAAIGTTAAEIASIPAIIAGIIAALALYVGYEVGTLIRPYLVEAIEALVGALTGGGEGGSEPLTEAEMLALASTEAIAIANTLRGNKDNKNTLAVIVTLDGDIVSATNGEGVYNSEVQ